MSQTGYKGKTLSGTCANEMSSRRNLLQTNIIWGRVWCCQWI